MDAITQGRPILERFRLSGKTALVTGAGQGIGRGFAHALAEAGAAVAVVDIEGPRAQEVAAELTAKGAEAIAIVADVTLPHDVKAMIDSVVKKWGTLTIGVNNAGRGQWIDAQDVTPEIWQRITRLNLEAVFYCCQAEASVMRQAGYGKIVNTASMSGHIVNTPQNQTPYNVSKAGVLHMTRSLAAEWASSGIRVNSISPGYTRTGLVEKLVGTPDGKEKMNAWMPRIPLRMMAEVTDLQGAVVYLASEVSDYMTGSDLVIDGGYCAL